MTISLYAVTAPVFTRMLTNLSRWLDKAEAWAKERRIDTAVLASARLAPDMYPLTSQVQSATDNAKFALARLAGVQPPSWPDEEKTFDELRQRIRVALDYVASFTPDQIDGNEDREITIRIDGKPTPMRAQDYLLNRALPNVYFHLTTAYAILRHNGVPVGKSDFLG